MTRPLTPTNTIRRRKPRTRKPRALIEPPRNPYAPIYRHAANLITEHGWCHTGAIDSEGRICLLIAITMAATDRAHHLTATQLEQPARHAAQHLNPDTPPGTAWPHIAYNDAPERTQTDVLNLLAQLSTP